MASLRACVGSVLLVLLTAATVASQPSDSPTAAPPSAPRVADREQLTGNWGGARDALAARGIGLQIELTGFLDGLVSGTGPHNPEAGVRLDTIVGANLDKLGLWKGSGLSAHLEAASGDIPVFRGGALWPPNSGMALPLLKRDEVVATSLYFTQQFGKTSTLLAGKINAVDLLARDPFFGGWGTHRFQNVTFVAPPSGLVPPVLMGAILAVAKPPYTFTAMVFDPADKTGKYWLDDLFDAGVNVQVGTTWMGALGGRTTSLGVSGAYSTADKSDLSDVLLPPSVEGGTKDGSWGLSLQASHLLVPSKVVKGKGLGVYGKAAISDGNPNVIRSSFAGGVAGHALVASRPHDSFGVGFFAYEFSAALQDTLEPVFGLDNEQGLEAFYSVAVARWCRVAADLQVLNPATRRNATAVVAGVRANVAF